MEQRFTVNVDEELCIGSGDCVALVPEAFSLDVGRPIVTVLPGASAANVEALQDAAMTCPTGAIRIAEVDQ